VAALLRDRCGDARLEISLIHAAAQQGIASELEQLGPESAARVQALVARLERHQGLTPPSARWAVETWAVALGVIPEVAPTAPAELPSTIPADGDPSPRRGLWGRIPIGGRVALAAALIVGGGLILWALFSSDGSEPLRGEAFLRAHVPVAIRASCASDQDDRGNWPEHTTAGIECSSGSTTLWYYELQSPDDLRADYDSWRDVPSDTPGDCSVESSESTYRSPEGIVLGRLACEVPSGDGLTRLAWTNEELLIMGEAVADADQSRAAYEAWKGAGPI
jgi:hypothetical protein